MSQTNENSILDAAILSEIESLRSNENASYESVAHLSHICLEKAVHHAQGTYLERLLESVQGQRKFTRLAQALRTIMDGTIKVSLDKINSKYVVSCHRLAKLALSQARQEKLFTRTNFFTLLNPSRKAKAEQTEKPELSDKQLAKRLQALLNKYNVSDFASKSLQDLANVLNK